MTRRNARIAELVAEIGTLSSRIARALQALKQKDARENGHIDETNSLTSLSYIRLLASSEGLRKIDNIIEQNFIVINTFSILSTTRYIIELLVWCRLLNLDPDKYACYYVAQLLADQLQHNKSNLEKVKSEVIFFEALQKEEDKGHEGVLTNQRNGLTAEALGQSFRLIAEATDRSARQNFSLYAHDAKTNGFGFQAFLLKQKALPQLQRLAEEVERLRAETKKKLPHWPTKWIWVEQARIAGLGEQFEYVYGYTSRLLHARPISFGTNQKNLEEREIEMFLDFIFVSIVEIIEMSEKLVGLANPSGH